MTAALITLAIYLPIIGAILVGDLLRWRAGRAAVRRRLAWPASER